MMWLIFQTVLTLVMFISFSSLAAVAALRQMSGLCQEVVTISQQNLLHSLKSLQPSAMRELALEVPQVHSVVPQWQAKSSILCCVTDDI